MSEPLTCEGETLVVNLHGALILTAIALRVGMKSRFMSTSQVNALQRRSCTSIRTNRGTAESNWRDLRTFGDYRGRQMIGMRGDDSQNRSCYSASELYFPVVHFFVGG